jgi:hypothetical protein
MTFKMSLVSRQLQRKLTGADSLKMIEDTMQHSLLPAAGNPNTPASHLDALARLAGCVSTTPSNPDPWRWRERSPDGRSSALGSWDRLVGTNEANFSSLLPAWNELCAPLRLEIIDALQSVLALNPSTSTWVLLLLRKIRRQRLRPIVEANAVWPLLQLEDPSLVSLAAQHAACMSVSSQWRLHQGTDGRKAIDYTIDQGVPWPCGIYDQEGHDMEITGKITLLPGDSASVVLRVWGLPNTEETL